MRLPSLAEPTVRDAVVHALRHPRYEVLPLDGTAEMVLAHVPRDVTVTVTASPRRGMAATLALTERLAAAGFAVVPHLSARLLADRDELFALLDRVEAAGVRELFVIAGDAAEPAGDYAGA